MDDQLDEVEVPKNVRLAQMLAKFQNAPTADQIEELKATYGEIFLSAITEDEIFLFRTVRRGEWRDMQLAVRGGQLDELGQEELVVNTCVLWKSVPDLSKKAGTLSTLAEQIMQNSNFMSSGQASMLVGKL